MKSCVTDYFAAEFQITFLTKSLETGIDDNQTTPYWVRPQQYSREEWLAMSEWLEKTMGKSRWDDIESKWIGSNERYWFRNEQDRTWFILRWT